MLRGIAGHGARSNLRSEAVMISRIGVAFSRYAVRGNEVLNGGKYNDEQ